MEYKGYSARVTFDEDAGVLFGEVEGLRDVVTFEATNVEDLNTAFEESVNDYLEMCAERKEPSEKPYSGKFLIRMDPKLHREVAMAAARSGKSLNAFTAQLIETWVQRGKRFADARKPTEATTTTVSKGVAEVLAEYLRQDPASVVASKEGQSAQVEVWTPELTGSRTPGSVWNTPPARRTPNSKTPSKQAERKAA